MPRKKSRIVQVNKLRKRILGVVILTIFAVSLFGYYSFYLRNGANQPRVDLGYSYQQIGPVDVKNLEQLGVKSTQNWTACFYSTRYGIFDFNSTTSGPVNCTGVEWTGNFSLGNANVSYVLSHYEWASEFHSSFPFLTIPPKNTSPFYTLAIGFRPSGNPDCDFYLPRSDVNCKEILLVNFENSTSSQIRRYTLANSYENLTTFNYLSIPTQFQLNFFDSDPSSYLLNSQLTLILETFQGYSWCPVYGVGNMTRLLCRVNPDYKYQEIASMNVSNLPSSGRFAWQNVALNYSFANVEFNHSYANGMLEVTVDSAPACEIDKPITQANCQEILLVGFEIANPPPNSGTPSEIFSQVQVGKTETFYLYPSNSGVHQQLYIILGSYVGDYQGRLPVWSWWH